MKRGWPEEVMKRDPFELFCLYYLGLTPEGTYQFVNANKLAARLNCTVDDLMGALRGHGLHPDTVLNMDFPMARYQVDVQMAAETESGDWLKDFAGRIYNEFRNHTGKPRDWLAEIDQENREESDGGVS